VPDLGVPVGDGPVAHVSTPQWQSFELRMRARKAERCLQRASAAIENGSIDEATAALEEARQIDPSGARVQELTARLEALSQPTPDLDLQLEAFSY
jgi:Tfp pilus assembly protein PilF